MAKQAQKIGKRGKRAATAPPAWHEDSKSWRKRITVDGKQQVFRYKFPRTPEGADAAAKAWAQDFALLEINKKEAERKTFIRKMSEALQSSDQTTRRGFERMMADAQSGYEPEQAQQREQTREQVIELANDGTPAALSEAVHLELQDHLLEATPAGATTVGPMFDDFLADQLRRVEHGKKFPKAPAKERLREATYNNIHWNAKSIRAEEVNGKAFELHAMPKDERGISKLLKAFRNVQVDKLNNNKQKANTFNNRIRTIRQFIGWAYANHRIEAMPRDISDLCAKYDYESEAKAIDVETIRKLYHAANDELKTFICLACNAGFYSSDIGSLTQEDIQDGYVVRPRQKTGVATKFKLWDVTKKLLADNANKTGKFLFTNRNGEPLVRYSTDNQTKNDNIRSMFWRLCRKPKIKADGVAFSNLRDTSATQVEQIDKTLTDTFLGHSDHRLARFYVDSDGVSHDKLDAAIDKLESFYGFKYTPPKKKAKK